MSVPTPMDCLDPPCMAPLACNQAGSCRHRQIDSAKSYDEALKACRDQGLNPFRKEERG